MLYSDLHTHTTASDGQYSPTELINLAKNANLNYIAITDHDTCKGLDEAEIAAKENDIFLINGIEFGTFEDRHQHILGYGFDKNNPQLKAICEKLIKSRDERKYRIIDYLRDYNFYIDIEEVEKVAGGNVIARPHFAQVMLKKGYVKSIREAFDKYLDTDKYMKIERFKTTAKECIEVINKAGGKAVLAHPIQLKYSDDKLFATLENLREYGLFGLECYYSTHTVQDTEKYIDMAKKLNLFITGGSDFHGEIPKPNIKLTQYNIDISNLMKDCFQQINLNK